MSKNKKEVEHLSVALNETVNRHIEEYDLCIAEVLGCLLYQALIQFSHYQGKKNE